MLRPLRAALLMLLLLPAAAPSARADATADLTAADRAAIRQVVQSQLEAFQRDDGAAAYAYASPMIQQKFGSPEVFMTMVRTAYEPVYRPSQVLFQEVVDLYGQPAQVVFLVGPDGEPVVAYYPMERQADGTWRIDGCILRETTDRMA